MPSVIPIPQEQMNKTAKQPWSLERRINLVVEGLQGHRSIAELCRDVGISPSRYYQWRQQVIDAARAGLTHPQEERQALEERVQRLEAENASLQRRLRIMQDLCVAD